MFSAHGTGNKFSTSAPILLRLFLLLMVWMQAIDFQAFFSASGAGRRQGRGKPGFQFDSNY